MSKILVIGAASNRAARNVGEGTVTTGFFVCLDPIGSVVAWTMQDEFAVVGQSPETKPDAVHGTAKSAMSGNAASLATTGIRGPVPGKNENRLDESPLTEIHADYWPNMEVIPVRSE